MLAIEGSYLPQIVRLFRLRRSEELSLFFPGLNLGGRLLALTYSCLTGEHVFAIGFLVGSALRLTLLLQIAAYRRPRLAALAPSAPPLVEQLAR